MAMTTESAAAPCICTDSCPEDDNDCPHCRTLDIYDPCPVVGFGCGECGDVDDPCCTPEQQKAASS